MKIFKTVMGILCILLFVFICFQSCSTGVVNALNQNNTDMSSAAGTIVGMFFLVCGITMLAGRSSKGASIVCGIFFLIASWIAHTGLGTFTDLKFYQYLALILGAIFLIGGILQSNNQTTAYDEYQYLQQQKKKKKKKKKRAE